MKLIITSAASLACVASLTAADSPANVLNSYVEKFAAANNYSWTAKVDPLKTGHEGQPLLIKTDGQTERNGSTYIITSEGGTITQQAVLKGSQVVVKLGDTWSNAQEIEDHKTEFSPGPIIVEGLRQLKRPDVELKELVKFATNLVLQDDAFHATILTQEVKRLIFKGAPPNAVLPELRDPKGTIEFKITQDQLAGYSWHIEGSIDRNNAEFKIDLATAITLTHVNATHVVIPPEAKEKLN